jgi:hypothetical protein
MNNYSSHIITGDTSQTTHVLDQLFNDNLRVIPLDKLKLPKTLPEFKLRDIVKIAEKIKQGELNEPLLVNREFMIVKGLKRYYALKYIGEIHVKVCICHHEFPTKNRLFSIKK